MILNIVDRRKRKYRWKKINAVIEDAWHDNSCKDTDKAKRVDVCAYDEREHITLSAAIRWASEHKGELTLYIYDKDGGIYPL